MAKKPGFVAALYDSSDPPRLHTRVIVPDGTRLVIFEGRYFVVYDFEEERPEYAFYEAKTYGALYRDVVL